MDSNSVFWRTVHFDSLVFNWGFSFVFCSHPCVVQGLGCTFEQQGQRGMPLSSRDISNGGQSSRLCASGAAEMLLFKKKKSKTREMEESAERLSLLAGLVDTVVQSLVKLGAFSHWQAYVVLQVKCSFTLKGRSQHLKKNTILYRLFVRLLQKRTTWHLCQLNLATHYSLVSFNSLYLYLQLWKANFTFFPLLIFANTVQVKALNVFLDIVVLSLK